MEPQDGETAISLLLSLVNTLLACSPPFMGEIGCEMRRELTASGREWVARMQDPYVVLSLIEDSEDPPKKFPSNPTDKPCPPSFSGDALLPR